MRSHVRIRPESHAMLRQLAQDAGATMTDVLTVAIEVPYRRRFLEKCNTAYSRLKSDPNAWKKVLAERRAWEATLGDGLDNAWR